ncbi:MAG: hypothetical protein F6K14_00315 [Symploca sp. SIO2C1]|nr:hypothetical protein [Symploca sp. SIO2C1]
MSYPVCKQQYQPTTLSVKLIVSGLMLVLIGTVKAPLVNAQPAIVPIITQAQETTESNKIANQLLGKWQARDPNTDELVTFIFAPEAKLLIVLPDKEESAIAIKMGYAIDVTTQPMQLEVIASPDEVAQTIFELTNEGKLRLELDGIDPGQPTPTAFSSNATLFEKISDSTTLPEDVQVVELETQPKTSKPKIPIQFITLLTKAQQDYYLENGKFAADAEELEIVTNLETQFYRYEIVPQGDSQQNGSTIGNVPTQSVAIMALPKPDTELPSYIGWLFITKVEGETTAIRRICESDESSIAPSVMPTIAVQDDSLVIQCPTGFTLLR